MRRWIRFFIGTPRRFLVTFIVISMIFCFLFPSIFAKAVDHALTTIVNGLSHLIGPALVVIIVFAGLRMIIGGKR